MFRSNEDIPLTNVLETENMVVCQGKSTTEIVTCIMLRKSIKKSVNSS